MCTPPFAYGRAAVTNVRLKFLLSIQKDIFQVVKLRLLYEFNIPECLFYAVCATKGYHFRKKVSNIATYKGRVSRTRP